MQAGESSRALAHVIDDAVAYRASVFIEHAQNGVVSSRSEVSMRRRGVGIVAGEDLNALRVAVGPVTSEVERIDDAGVGKEDALGCP